MAQQDASIQMERDVAELAIHARGVSKRFGGAQALADVDLDVAPGECHGIVGENGAGKSTLMRILAGLVEPDSGTIEVFGRRMQSSPEGARTAGISLVHQERSLVSDMSVAENVCLGTMPSRYGIVRRRQQRRVAEELLERVGMPLDPSRTIASLSSAQQQFVELAKALRTSPRVLILDEPSSSLTSQETGRLLELIEELRTGGMAILYISHRLSEVYSACREVTVLRDGRLIRRAALSTMTQDELVELLVGRALAHDLGVHRATDPGDVVIKAEHIDAPPLVRDVSLSVRAGEIVGLGGLVGAGRTELVRAIVGLDPRRAGKVTVIDQRGRARRIETYTGALRAGVAFVPEERRTEGVMIGKSIEENFTLSARRLVSRQGVLAPGLRMSNARDLVAKMRIIPPEPGRQVGSLSGGNQQKVAFGKWLPVKPSVLVLDEPTRGVDVGAKAEIHSLIRAAADEGAAVLFVSSDLLELLALADRIVVIRDGQIAGTVAGPEATEQKVMSLAIGRTRQANAVGASTEPAA